MFTLKFTRNTETHFISCQSFTHYLTPSGVNLVTVYPGFTTVNGVQYVVCSDEVFISEPNPPSGQSDYYHECIVLNDEGKELYKFT